MFEGSFIALQGRMRRWLMPSDIMCGNRRLEDVTAGSTRSVGKPESLGRFTIDQHVRRAQLNHRIVGVEYHRNTRGFRDVTPQIYINDPEACGKVLPQGDTSSLILTRCCDD